MIQSRSVRSTITLRAYEWLWHSSVLREGIERQAVNASLIVKSAVEPIQRREDHIASDHARVVRRARDYDPIISLAASAWARRGHASLRDLSFSVPSFLPPPALKGRGEWNGRRCWQGGTIGTFRIFAFVVMRLTYVFGATVPGGTAERSSGTMGVI
jgi:hypothetical protein